MVVAASMTRCNPSQIGLTPGSPSPFLARKPPRVAIRRRTSLSRGGRFGGLFFRQQIGAFNFVRIEEQRGLARVLAQRRNRRARHRYALLHRFQHGQTGPLEQAREHDEPGEPVEREQLCGGDESGEADLMLEPQVVPPLLNRRPDVRLPAAADDVDDAPGVAERGDRVEQARVIFVPVRHRRVERERVRKTPARAQLFAELR